MNTIDFMEYSTRIRDFSLAVEDICDLKAEIDPDDKEAQELLEDIKEAIETLRKTYHV